MACGRVTPRPSHAIVQMGRRHFFSTAEGAGEAGDVSKALKPLQALDQLDHVRRASQRCGVRLQLGPTGQATNSTVGDSIPRRFLVEVFALQPCFVVRVAFSFVPLFKAE
eukprot:CAMPEP_0202066178 /NCGR_PEP_ID=MMETSP0963-20130614/53315_1 /ASSEMBLY_ACC=CAM_ASM_000494 /TAXON_ID=4773 /ORGANISM="Schizochytrium aggregatum, Strain ATCC28209" /LENGTH=109 /DNA_ID=CAMNT_0048632843 /DNA_START=32 /DNA_END=358 /DNA_ORIENTATION=-